MLFRSRNFFVLISFIHVIMLSFVLFSFRQSIKKTLFSVPSFFFFSSRLNLAKDTKLLMYPREGSSHNVLQQIFFYFIFLNDFLQKGGLSV